MTKNNLVTPKPCGNPILIQSNFGHQGNFELVVPMTTGGLGFYWRDNDHEELPWNGPILFAQEVGQVDAVTMIQSNYGHVGNLELVARINQQLAFFWRDWQDADKWNGPFFFGNIGVSGNPVLVQTSFDYRGSFQLVVPMQNGGLEFYSRNNDDEIPWSKPIAFAEEVGRVDAVTMVQSNFGHQGNLELIARIRDQLAFFWADAEANYHWHGPFFLDTLSGVSGIPALIQSNFGYKGNFELVVPTTTSGLAFYWRDNDHEVFPWNGPILFGKELGHVDAVTMIQSNYGDVGNLELVARVGDKLAFFWRGWETDCQWHGPFFFG